MLHSPMRFAAEVLSPFVTQRSNRRAQVNWLKDRIEKIPSRFVFESALELMSSTRVGSFSMASEPGKKQGMPPAIKTLLGKFSSKREEDRLDGYTSFLKIGPKVLKYMPFEKAQDMKRWLSTYAR